MRGSCTVTRHDLAGEHEEVWGSLVTGWPYKESMGCGATMSPVILALIELPLSEFDRCLPEEPSHWLPHETSCSPDPSDANAQRRLIGSVT
jgi:hypothetical protein